MYFTNQYTTMFAHDINYIAFLVAGIVPMVVGFLWYGPLFGKDWMALVGMTEEKAKAGSSRALSISIILSFVLSYVMHRILMALSAITMGDACMVAFMCWLGFSVTMTGMNVAYEGRPNKLLFLYAGYSLVTFLLMAIVQTLLL